MTSSQQYAELADDTYGNYKVGSRKPGEEEKVDTDRVEYKLLEHANNRRSGYQGSIYQRVDSPRETAAITAPLLGGSAALSTRRALPQLGH